MRYSIIYSIILLFLFSQFGYTQNSYQLYQEGKSLEAGGKDRKAIKKFEESLEAAISEKNIQMQMNNHIALAELKDNVVNYKEALNHYKEFSRLYKLQASLKEKQLEESVTGLKSEVEASQEEIEKSHEEIEKKNTDIKKKESAIDSLTTEQLQAQLDIKDLELTNSAKELALKESQNRWNLLLFILASLIIMAFFIARGYMVKRRSLGILKKMHGQIVIEKKKSEDLLLNILPETVAGELKERGKTTPHQYEKATVMFTDFVGFTKFSEKRTPKELVESVDYYFSAFDQIMKKYNIEKIKTIGDAYMCVSGIPESNGDEASNMIKAAFEIREFVNKEAIEKEKQGLPFLKMRIGIHSGPLVAGVVGSRKFAYDVWGDTVNIAARMEQSGEADCINISETVYQQVKDEYEMEYRGEVEAKNKGKMKMYFVLKAKKDLVNLN